MQTGVRNPFEPPLEMVPLSLSLDSRSLADVDGELGDQVAYLLELCDTELIDPLVVWRRPGFREDLPTVELRDVPERGDELLVVNPGERGFVGVVRIASQYGKMADSAGLSGEDREWFVHYGIAAVGFHSRSPRHYFVTADERLLKARDEGPVPALWKRARIVSVPQALALLGRLMRMHGRTYLVAGPREQHTISTYTLYHELAIQLVADRRYFFKHLQPHPERGDIEIQAYQESVLWRAMDLLKARDRVGWESMRTEQNNATVDEILYHVRGAVATSAAIFDSIAVLASLVLEISEDDAGGRQRIGFAERDFRKLVEARGAIAARAVASSQTGLFSLIRAFRHPILHRSGVGGWIVSHGPAPPSRSPSESRVRLDEDQRSALLALGVEQARRLGAAHGRQDQHREGTYRADRSRPCRIHRSARARRAERC